MARVAVWDVTSTCNLRCVHCAVRDTYEQTGHAALDLEQAATVLGRLRDGGYEQLQLLGGEPLIRPDIVEIVSMASGLGFPGIRVVTNGTRLDADLAERLIEAGLTEIVLSVEGATAATHDDIRGKGTFDRAINGLRALIERRGDQRLPRAVLQFTLTRTNLEEAPTMVELATQLGVNLLTINELRMAGGVLRDIERLLPDLDEAMDAREAIAEAGASAESLSLLIFGRPRVIAYLNDRYGIDQAIGLPDCSLVNGHRTVYVEANGRTSACSAAHVADGTSPAEPLAEVTSLGPERDPAYLQLDTLQEILQSPRFDDVREVVDQAFAHSWQDEFIPCARCQFRPGCLICPIFLKERVDKMIPECLLAIQRHSRWRKATRSLQKRRAAPPAPEIGKDTGTPSA